MTRIYGDDAYFGTMFAIHSTTMIVGVLIFTVLTYRYSSYTLIIAGSVVGTLGTFIMSFGDDYWIIVGFVVCISFGESLYVPRMLDYTLNIAPHGTEGVYLALY